MSTDLWFGGALVQVRATGVDTEGAYAVIEERAPAGFATPRHVHSREDEAFLVLDGELRFWQDDEAARSAGPGAFVFIQRGRPHAFRVESPVAHFLNVVSPAGLEHFFAELGMPAAEATMPPGPPPEPDLAAMQRVLGAYGVELLGPPPA